MAFNSNFVLESPGGFSLLVTDAQTPFAKIRFQLIHLLDADEKASQVILICGQGYLMMNMNQGYPMPYFAYEVT